MIEANTTKKIALPIAELPEGPVGPPMEPDDPSWQILGQWEDPLAPRAGFRVQTHKHRAEFDGAPCIEWETDEHGRAIDERAMVTGSPTWREYSLQCRVQVTQADANSTNDDWQVDVARAGLIFRAATVRRHHYFCMEGLRRLVLYRRIDQEWFELAAADVEYSGEPITLRVALDGDGIRASCLELGVDLFATDTMIPTGRCGFRALAGCRLFDLEVSITPSQHAVNQRYHRAARAPKSAADALPQPIQIDEVSMPDGYSWRATSDVRSRDATDLILRGEDGLALMTWDGEIAWRLDEPVSNARPGPVLPSGARAVYVLAGEQLVRQRHSVRGLLDTWRVAADIVVLDGATGEELARTRLPDAPDVESLRMYDFSYEVGCLSSDDGSDILVRQWRRDLGDGGMDLWAYNGDLELLWHQEVYPPYGHGNCVHLVELTGDGRSEVIAGGTVLSAEGEIIATHDLAHEMDEIHGAGHYDAVVAGHFADDTERDPVAFLISGSAGVYVIDPLTGHTRSVHRVGHAQGGFPCHVRDDIPGTQVLALTRWGNYGILTVFSGTGGRLWSIQPHFIPSVSAVQWAPDGPQHLWVHASRETMGLYDGYGRLVTNLPTLEEAWGDSAPNAVQGHVMRRSPDGPDLMAFIMEQRILLFGPER